MSALTGTTVADDIEGDGTLAGDGWYPDVDLAALRAACRLPGTVTPARLRISALAAVASVNRELATYKLLQQQAGHERLDDVPADQVAGQSILVVHYLRAVYAYAHAELVERYRDADTTGAGDKKADALEPTADTLRRNMRWAISDILGIGRSTVELI